MFWLTRTHWVTHQPFSLPRLPVPLTHQRARISLRAAPALIVSQWAGRPWQGRPGRHSNSHSVTTVSQYHYSARSFQLAAPNTRLQVGTGTGEGQVYITELLTNSTLRESFLPHIASVGGETPRIRNSAISDFWTFEQVTQADRLTLTHLLKVALEILILLTKSNLANWCPNCWDFWC